MKLSAAARHFDRQVLTDAYGTATLRGQFDLFDDSKRDGGVTRRRTLSVAPGTAIPARRVLELDGIRWIVGNLSPDYFGEVAIRHKYTLQQADGLAAVQTFSQLLSDTPGISAYAAIDWVRAAKEIDESSDLNDIMSAVLAPTEDLPSLAILTLNGVYYLVREPHATAAGFRAAYADEIGGQAVEQGTFTQRVYEPVSDTWTEAGTEVSMLRLRWQTHFRYLSQRTPSYQPGDDVLVCLKSAITPAVNDHITLSDGRWQVLAVRSEDATCWSLHVRSIPA